jgi:hypothetical protein
MIEEYERPVFEEPEIEVAPAKPEPVDVAQNIFSKHRQHSASCDSCDVFATCERQQNGGECCRCLEGYVGNGKYCFAEGQLFDWHFLSGVSPIFYLCCLY